MIDVNATELGYWTTDSLKAILAWLEREGIDPRDVARFKYEHPHAIVTHFKRKGGERYVDPVTNHAATYTLRYTVNSVMPELVYRMEPPQTAR